MQPSDYQNIGQYLKESRESLRVSIPQAADALHIRARYIEALESGDLKELPGKTYTRGYIKNYANYLQLDADKVLDAYADILGPRSSELFIPEPMLQQNMPTNWLLWLSLLGLGVIYGCWYFGIHDRTAVRRIVADLPASFAHLLDKTPAVDMDKPWKDCLESDDAACFAALRAQTVIPQPMSVYDLSELAGPLPKS